MELKLEAVHCVAHYPIVLIVPYGIETGQKQQNPVSLLVLIIPYGIETTGTL